MTMLRHEDFKSYSDFMKECRKRAKLIVKDVNKGHSFSRIGRRFGISKQAAFRIYKRANQ